MKSNLCKIISGVVCVAFTLSSASFSGNIVTDAVSLESIPLMNATTTCEESAESEIIISETIEVLPDTSIEMGEFESCSSLESITIENADCEVYDNSNTLNSRATIYGYPNFTAQAYAEKYNSEFVTLEESDEKELNISVDSLNMGESVTITLHGQPGQSFNGTFDFSQSDIESGINTDLNAPAEQLDENGEYEFVFEAPWDMNAFTLHISYTGEPITYTKQYSWEENQTKNLSIPVKELSRNNTVFVVLTGEANQTFQPSFEFSEADLNMGIGGFFNTKEMTLDENGRFEFRFSAPWAMDAFAFNIAYSGSDITYEISYDIPEEISTTTTTTTTTTITTTTTSTTTSTTTAPEQTPTQTKTFVNGEDNWSFDNSDQNFPKGYYINDTYLEKLLDGLSNAEQESIMELLSYDWAGSCYGMAATSILAANDILNPSLWQADAQVLYDIKAPISDDTTSLINYYFALQDTDFIQQQVCKNFYNDNEGEKIQQLLACMENHSPVLLCYHGYFYGFMWGGHAVVAYDVEQNGYTINGEYYDTKIVTYDNNLIDYNEDYCMYINTSNNTWIIPGYYLDSRYDSILGLFTDDLDIINYHGYIDNNGEAGMPLGSYIATMNSNAVKSKFSVQKVLLSDDGYTINSGTDDEIKMFSSIGDMQDKNIGANLKFAMLDSEAGYMMNLEELEQQNLNIRYENSFLNVKSSNSDTVIFEPTGYIQVNGADSDYHLSMTFNEGHYTEDWYKVSVLGKNADTVKMTKVEGGYILEADNLRNIAVSIKNENIHFTKSFTADAQKAFIYEIDENTIGVKIDSDQDNQFESEITTYLSGDANSDNAINAEDASAVLKEAATIGAGLDGEFSTEQGYSADVNGDGNINAEDASYILSYAAYVGVGGQDSLPVYLSNDNN